MYLLESYKILRALRTQVHHLFFFKGKETEATNGLMIALDCTGLSKDLTLGSQRPCHHTDCVYTDCACMLTVISCFIS